MKPKLIYTLTDEAPALATASFLPVIKTFAGQARVDLETRDISLAARIIAAFPEKLDAGQRLTDDLAELGELVRLPDTIIIKLPNISASVPQMKEAIRELQSQGYRLPDYPEHPLKEEEREIKLRYDRIKGSAVNPVLREGNSDRRVPAAVKKYAKNHPYTIGPWDSDSKTHVASMNHGDFYGSEVSMEIVTSTTAVIDFIDSEGNQQVLKQNIPLETGEIVDTAVMNIPALDQFLLDQMEEARREKVLFSIHLKATMMKVSDPVIFGRAVYAYGRKIFETHSSLLKDLDVSPDHGLADLLAKIQGLPEETRAGIQRDLEECFHQGPELAMVDATRGITNLHAPNNVIIDASMPAAIRSSGRMGAPDGSMKDIKAVIPDRTYAGVYKAVIDFCKEHGALDPSALGTVSNIGLMAGKAEEYGSHDTTFIAPETGTIRLISGTGAVLMKQPVEKGDIFRMCRVRDEAVRNWVDLAVERARETGLPVVFWLDDKRPHDRKLIEKVTGITDRLSTHGLDLRILSPSAATTFTLKRMAAGLDTLAVTGNVLRDYLTDLFPILELGTSSKMLSIVPLLQGGRLFETGSGGSAPKHVQQFLEEGHLRWDSLGEFLALSEALHHLAFTSDATKAGVLARALERGTEELLENGKAPSRNTGELDTRGSHFYLTLYWAQALAAQNEDGELKKIFSSLADQLLASEQTILAELNETQGHPVDLGGYYHPDPLKLEKAMRPSRTFNAIVTPESHR